MLFTAPSGNVLCTGSCNYDSRPSRAADSTNRLYVTVNIETVRTEAVIDTGAPYLVLNPSLAHSLNLYTTDSLLRVPFQAVNFFGFGDIHRVTLELLADRGSSFAVDVTALVPVVAPEQEWDLPVVLGWDGCLERIRFAIDPVYQMFYFGECA